MVEHSGHRPLPLGDHRQAMVFQGSALTRSFECDDPVPRVDHRGEHRQELLDIAVESAEDDDGASRRCTWRHWLPTISRTPARHFGPAGSMRCVPSSSGASPAES
jgi:hypothetical protein